MNCKKKLCLAIIIFSPNALISIISGIISLWALMSVKDEDKALMSPLPFASELRKESRANCPVGNAAPRAPLRANNSWQVIASLLPNSPCKLSTIEFIVEFLGLLNLMEDEPEGYWVDKWTKRFHRPFALFSRSNKYFAHQLVAHLWEIPQRFQKSWVAMWVDCWKTLLRSIGRLRCYRVRERCR